jgi:hypothetical protein
MSKATARRKRKPEIAAYEPRGACLDLLRCHAPEVLISGPAGTGKTLACLWKLHTCAVRVPRIRALIVRKTRHSLTQSVLVTFEQRVVPPDWPILAGAARAHREAYHYPNGSEIALGGMDLSSRVMSSEYDLIYVPEATELAEGEWEDLTSRLRHYVLPFQQLLADCNPDKPTHWLKRRCDAGRTLQLESRHEDNPTVTPAYLAVLDALTGPRKERLRFGRWAQAEGLVYGDWDAARHVVQPFSVPPSWPRYWAVDFGFTNPFVWQEWAQDPDGRLYLVREVYHTGRLVEDHARRIKELTRNSPRPRAVLCDHDAEDRATLERHLQLRTTPAPKEISPGIQSVASRLRLAGDGKPRLFVVRGALDERDPALDARKAPCSTAEEWDGYVWDTRAGRKKGEAPMDRDDHGLDACRYLVHYLDGKPRSVAPPPMSPTAGLNIVDRTRRGGSLGFGAP